MTLPGLISASASFLAIVVFVVLIVWVSRAIDLHRKQGGGLPWGEAFARSKREIREVGIVSGAVALVTALFVVIPVWLVLVGFAPHFGAFLIEEPEKAAADRLRVAAGLRFQSAQVRVEQKMLGNVDIWVEKAHFEEIPFPDRDVAVKTLAPCWCTAADPYFLPSLYVRDLRSGEVLARQMCFTAY